jgi:ribonucleotide reductase beta subunit family protein with ferritin-like domain
VSTHITGLTSKHLLTINRDEICHLQWIIEGYDGIDSMRTIDPEKGEIEISIAPGCEKEMFSLINYLTDEGSIHVTHKAL